MDRLLYVAMNGAKSVMLAQDAVAQNAANASTPGYRAQVQSFSAYLGQAAGQTTRAYAVAGTAGTDFAAASIVRTGNPLDVAVQTQGFIAVQGQDGREAYTRAGALRVSADGLLQTQSGLNVLGESGPIAIQQDTQVTVAPDGTVSTVPSPGGQAVNTVNVVDRIKLVNPPTASLARGDDGLFRLASGQPAPADAAVRLAAGAIEGSNVNVVDAVTQMIDLARRFDLQTKMMQTASDDEQQTAKIMDLNA